MRAVTETPRRAKCSPTNPAPPGERCEACGWRRRLHVRAIPICQLCVGLGRVPALRIKLGIPDGRGGNRRDAGRPPARVCRPGDTALVVTEASPVEVYWCDACGLGPVRCESRLLAPGDGLQASGQDDEGYWLAELPCGGRLILPGHLARRRD